jgi:mono/diheme cytochrome c family protein
LATSRSRRGCGCRAGARSRRGLLAGLALASLATAPGCTRIDNALASVPVFAFMRSAPSFDPYEHPLPAPPGAIPFESPNGPVLPPLEASEQALTAFAAGRWGVNPLDADDAAALALGQVMYDRHCSVCHGVTGLGDGPVVGPGRFPLAPSLVEAPATDRTDGYVYAVIRAGRGLMPAYGTRMTHTERWAVVNYVNSLQARAGAVPEPAAGPAPQPAPGQVPDQAPQPSPQQDTVVQVPTPPAQPDTLPSPQ